jgi:hypothetical protein
MHVEPIIVPLGATLAEQEEAYSDYEAKHPGKPLKRYPFQWARVDREKVLVGWVRVG